MTADGPRPAVSIAVICDFEPGGERAWDDMRAALRAVGDQDFNEPVEVLLLEAGSLASRVPDDVRQIIPGIKLVPGPEGGSYHLKNEAAHTATADLLILLDADCVPERDWVRLLVTAIRANPDAVAVSTKTEYAGRTLIERIQSLLSRSFLDPGRFGETRFISNNSAIFRRAEFLVHPLPLECRAQHC